MNVASLLLFAACGIATVCGHGYLMDPPARNCAWRFGFPTPKNYDDTELNCGAFGTQWQTNGGKCGVCGDPYNESPQKHVAPGKYATGTITRRYKQGQQITLEVKLTRSHLGYFQFKIGEVSKPPVKAEDLKYTLILDNGSTRLRIPYETKVYTVKAQLPAGLTCKQCVIQWVYRAGNSWGCENGKCGMGKGEQEHFINCADVAIE